MTPHLLTVKTDLAEQVWAHRRATLLPSQQRKQLHGGAAFLQVQRLAEPARTPC